LIGHHCERPKMCIHPRSTRKIDRHFHKFLQLFDNLIENDTCSN
jgi:hypothetical protein